MEYPELDQLRNTLERLKPVDHAETAKMAWSRIKEVAVYFRLQSQVHTWEGPLTPKDLANELQSLSGAAQRFRNALKKASPQCRAWLGAADGENGNYFSEWFPIEPAWRGEERDESLDTNDAAAEELESLATELKLQADLISLLKEPPKGLRRDQMKRDTLFGDLAELVDSLGRPQAHATHIGKAILKWAGVPVGAREGERTSKRMRKQTNTVPIE